jgi:membrane-associated phospholipid phosphatase
MEQLRDMGNAIILQILIAAVFYLVWPFENPNEVYTVTGWAGVPFKVAETVNLSYNSFPSLHVALSLTAAVFYSRVVSRFKSLLLSLWAGLISVSTVLMHEHYVIDVLGGLLLVPTALFLLRLKIKNSYGEEPV